MQLYLRCTLCTATLGDTAAHYTHCTDRPLAYHSWPPPGIFVTVGTSLTSDPPEQMECEIKNETVLAKPGSESLI